MTDQHANENDMTDDLILQAVARGWCAPENANKVMDPDLAIAIAREVRAAADEVTKAAADLYDNRLGWSDGRNPYAPPEFWSRLGRALGRPETP
jgi:hypothetical protein